MPRPSGSTSTPSYRRHRKSGQAIVTLSGRDHYLGLWQSKVSRIEYDRLIGEWLASGRRTPASKAGSISVIELIDRYWTFAENYFASPDGHAGQIDGLKQSLKVVKALYGHTPAVDFGPLALRSVRNAMVKKGWCRTHVNAQVGRVKRMVKWAVAQELLPPDAHHALSAVEGLRYGKSEARESDPIKSVAAPFVDAVLPFLTPTVKAMVELQSLTGMRSGELCQLRGCDIDTTAEVWTYKPARHKTQHRGHERIVYLGKRAQDIIKPLLNTDLHAYLFNPSEAVAQRREQRRADRKTPIGYGNSAGTNRVRKPRKTPGVKYDTHSYRRAVYGACDKAFPPPAHLARHKSESNGEWYARLAPALREELKAWHKAHRWHPHQLRHSHATNVRKRYGLEAVQAALGQKSVTAAQIYAEQNEEVGRRVASEVG